MKLPFNNHKILLNLLLFFPIFFLSFAIKNCLLEILILFKITACHFSFKATELRAVINMRKSQTGLCMQI